MIDFQHLNLVPSSIAISEGPLALALLNDGLIAVTTDGKVIYLLTVALTLTIRTSLPAFFTTVSQVTAMAT
jgi:hypothetical protein